MQTRDYLGQIYRLNKTIQNKIEELAEYKELAFSISAVTNDEKIQASLTQDRIGNALAKIEQLEKNLDELIDSYVDKRNLIISQIENMENETYYEILFSRYVEKKKLEQISVDMDYTFRHTTRLHGLALQEFERKYGETYLNL